MKPKGPVEIVVPPPKKAGAPMALFALLAAVPLVVIGGYVAWRALLGPSDRIQIRVEENALGRSAPVTRTGFNYQPHFARDSRHIVFAHRESVHQNRTTLTIADVVTGKGQNVFFSPDIVTSPQWIAGDRKIAFIRELGVTNNEIWTIDVATGRTRRFLKGSFRVESLKASPDGKTLLFTTSGWDRAEMIATIPADGREPTILAAFTDERDGPEEICWTGDSSRIVYLNRRRQLVVISPDGHEVLRRDLPAYMTSVQEIITDHGDPGDVILAGTVAPKDFMHHLTVYSLKDGQVKLNRARRSRLQQGYDLSPDRKFLVYSA